MNIYIFIIVDKPQNQALAKTEYQPGCPFIMLDNIRAILATEYAKPEEKRDLEMMRELSMSLWLTNQSAKLSAGTKTEYQRKELSDHTKWLVSMALERKSAHYARLAMTAVNNEGAPDLYVLQELSRISGL